MVETAFLDALRLILDRLDGHDVCWALTGSLGMALQGMPVNVHDIDLQADKPGAYEIEQALSEFVTEPVRPVISDRMRSHFGRLVIQGVPVEIMGELDQRGPAGAWDPPVDLPPQVHFARLDRRRVPVLSLAYEAGAYARLGRVEKAAQLREWAAAHLEINAITNYRLVLPWLGTAGQPGKDQLALIAAEGYRVLINLALSDSPGAIPEERGLVEGLGMEYLPIPVIWQQPERSDLERFFQVVDERQGQTLFVHCAMNMRVSAFVFLYRVLRLGHPSSGARQEMERIWTPDVVWQEFIEKAFAHVERGSRAAAS